MVCSNRPSKLVGAGLLAICGLLFIVLPCSAQDTRSSFFSSNCSFADFDSQVHFLNSPGDYYATVVDSRNISNHPCTLDGPGMGSNCVPGRIQGDQLANLGYLSSGYECKFSADPLILYPGQVVRRGLRWRTTRSDRSVSCFQPMTSGGLNVLVAAPTLVKKACSNLEVSPYYLVVPSDDPLAAGQATNPDQTPLFNLTSNRNRYYEGEFFTLHVALVQPTTEDLLRQEGCPTVYLRHKSPDGAVRIDQEGPMAFKGCSTFVPGYEPGDWQSGFELDSRVWTGLGEHTFEVLRLRGSLDDPELHFAISNVLRIKMDDPALIPRKWGRKVKGIAVDITLDKNTFRVGEDVPLHLAVENFHAKSPIYGPDPRYGCVGIVGIEVQDANGHSLQYDNRISEVSLCSGPYSGPRPYPKGKIVPFEQTLRGEGWLPVRPGTYTVVATWTPSDDPSKGNIPYAIAHDTATIHIVGGDNQNLR